MNQKFPKIPIICQCEDIFCNEVCWNGREFKRGHNNKTKSGKYKISERMKICNPTKGKHLSESHKENLRRSHIGIERTDDWCNNISRSLMNNKNAIGNKSLLGWIPSQETRDLWSRQRSKENNSNWRGGTSYLPYCKKFDNDLKESVIIRDNYTCQLCGKTQEQQINKIGKRLTPHHIHYDKQNCYPDLITLCCSCNLKVNWNRLYYESLFMNKLNDRQLLFWTRRNIKS